MLADRLPIYLWRPPNELGGTSVGLRMCVDDADVVVQRALAAGARVTLTVEDKFYVATSLLPANADAAESTSPTGTAAPAIAQRDSPVLVGVIGDVGV